MSEFKENLWAPWRMQYIRSLGGSADKPSCFLCDYWSTPDGDQENHVVWRTALSFVVMNRFPYTNGHLMIAPARHIGDLEDLTDDEMVDITRQTTLAVGVLRSAVRAEGFNVGFNLGLCAGAGLPGHVHAHVVPRWSGDTNYMAVLGDVRVVPDALDALYQELANLARDRGLTHPKQS